MHVLPLTDNKTAITFIENNSNKSISAFEIQIDSEGNYTSDFIETSLGKHIPPCEKGAGQISNLGTAFGALVLVGCVPCGFAGGAIIGITALMAMFCP